MYATTAPTATEGAPPGKGPAIALFDVERPALPWSWQARGGQKRDDFASLQVAVILLIELGLPHG